MAERGGQGISDDALRDDLTRRLQESQYRFMIRKLREFKIKNEEISEWLTDRTGKIEEIERRNKEKTDKLRENLEVIRKQHAMLIETSEEIERCINENELARGFKLLSLVEHGREAIIDE